MLVRNNTPELETEGFYLNVLLVTSQVPFLNFSENKLR